jgi:hypothetical protein
LILGECKGWAGGAWEPGGLGVEGMFSSGDAGMDAILSELVVLGVCGRLPVVFNADRRLAIAKDVDEENRIMSASP